MTRLLRFIAGDDFGFAVALALGLLAFSQGVWLVARIVL